MNTADIKIFGAKKVRTLWNEDDEDWYFSIVDVMAVLTDSVAPAAYWRKLKQRLKEEGNESVTNCHALKMPAPGRLFCLPSRRAQFRIQSICSEKVSKPGSICKRRRHTGATRPAIVQEVTPEFPANAAFIRYFRLYALFVARVHTQEPAPAGEPWGAIKSMYPSLKHQKNNIPRCLHGVVDKSQPQGKKKPPQSCGGSIQY